MILKPHSYMNVNKNILVYTAFLIQILLKKKRIKFNELYKDFSKQSGTHNIKHFIFSLNFLYCLGKVNYNAKKDVIELLAVKASTL